jgi:hypothetical protein
MKQSMHQLRGRNSWAGRELDRGDSIPQLAGKMVHYLNREKNSICIDRIKQNSRIAGWPR